MVLEAVMLLLIRADLSDNGIKSVVAGCSHPKKPKPQKLKQNTTTSACVTNLYFNIDFCQGMSETVSVLAECK